MAFLYATSAFKFFFLKAMSENLNQKRKYIKIQNLNLNKTNFKIFSFKLFFFFPEGFTVTPFFSPQQSIPKALSSTDPISQILTIPKSFNGLCKPLKFQLSCSISFTSRSHSQRSSSFVFNASRSNKLYVLVQALSSSQFKPPPLPLMVEAQDHGLNTMMPPTAENPDLPSSQFNLLMSSSFSF